ncbi:MAG: RNA polymerase sigma factor [Solirubrobacteraceae bacterium]
MAISIRSRRRGGRDLRQLADEDLMSLVADTDADAFAVVYDRHVHAAFSLAYRMCGKRALAEDIVQEAFVSLWRSAGGYERARGSVRNWVLRIVHNRGVDALRRSVVRDGGVQYDEEIAERMPASERTDEEIERRERSAAVHGALGLLPLEQRRVIELAYFSGFTHVEIAEMLQMPIGTVKGRMRLGLAKLRTPLRELDERALEER